MNDKNFVESKNRSLPYYITQRKLIISRYIQDIKIINEIFRYIDDSLIIKGSIGGLNRSLKLLNVDISIYIQLKKAIHDILGFNISCRDSICKYSISEINSVGCFISDMELGYADGTTVDYKEFDLCDIHPSMKFIIKKIPCSKYDVICGLDILLYLMHKLYGMRYKKISKVNREKSITYGVKVIRG